MQPRLPPQPSDLSEATIWSQGRQQCPGARSGLPSGLQSGESLRAPGALRLRAAGGPGRGGSGENHIRVPKPSMTLVRPSSPLRVPETVSPGHLCRLRVAAEGPLSRVSPVRGCPPPPLLTKLPPNSCACATRAFRTRTRNPCLWRSACVLRGITL